MKCYRIINFQKIQFRQVDYKEDMYQGLRQRRQSQTWTLGPLQLSSSFWNETAF